MTFAIRGDGASIRVGDGANGMKRVVLKHGQAEAHIYLHGGHVTYWRTHSGVEALYLSPKAIFSKDKALRGGVPVCWPQFSDFGPLKTSHGFARTADWEFAEAVASMDDGCTAVLQLVRKDDPHFMNHSYTVTMEITIAKESLEMTLGVRNDGSTSLPFTAALHSYFAVRDISNVRLGGVLDELDYADNLQQRAIQPRKNIHSIDQEIDRIYYGTAGNPVVINDEDAASGTRVSIQVTATNFPDTVLWNPWVEKTLKMGDMPEDGYKRFVCVESACIKDIVEVSPGQTYKAVQRVQVERGPLSKSSL